MEVITKISIKEAGRKYSANRNNQGEISQGCML